MVRRAILALGVAAIALVAIVVVRGDQSSGLDIDAIVGCTRPLAAEPAALTVIEPGAAQGPSAVAELFVELDRPLGFALWPDGRWLVGLRTGPLVLVDPDSGETDNLFDLTDRITELNDEGGVLGLAVSPDEAHVYVHYTDGEGDSHIVGFPIDGDRLGVEGERELLVEDHAGKVHNGGALAFGPDGYLYFGFGDGSVDAADALGSESLDTLDAKLLRIAPTPDGDEPYIVPPDNPYVGVDGRDEIFASGLRNPWRLSFDAKTGDLWIGDVGNSCWEEINVSPAGAAGLDFGWPRFEASHLLAADGVDDVSEFPVLEYAHDGRCAAIGGSVYRGSEIDDLEGRYIYADLCDGIVRWFDRSTGETGELGATVGSVFSFATDADGELLVLGPTGIHRIG